MTEIDPLALRSAFGSFMTGVTVVTTQTPDGLLLGFTANSFSSVSLDPPLLLVCPGKFLSSYDIFAECSHFAVNVLAEGQEEVSNIFARPGEDRFGQIEHVPDQNGSPLIAGAVAQFSCAAHQVLEMGDHAILIGQVQDFRHSQGPGLGYVGGRYFSLGLERAALEEAAGTSICGAIVSVGDKVLLERTAEGLRPPEIDYEALGTLLPKLREKLAQHDIAVEIGLTYSVFNDPTSGVHSTYFLGQAKTVPTNPEIVAVPISELAGQTFTSPAISRMMSRFATEAQTQSFALYLGDAEQGDVHSLS